MFHKFSVGEVFMARRVFFSFEYGDVSRAMIVRNSWVTQGKESAGFVDSAEFEKIKKRGDDAIRTWIDNQLYGTSVTVVLIGEKTSNSQWVKYEIKKSQEKGNGILGIDISKIKDLQGNTTERCNYKSILPNGCAFYLWFKEEGYCNIGKWIENAGKKVAA